MPAEDWPLGSTRAQHAPTLPAHPLGLDDGDIVLKMASRLKTTRLESRILLVVLRRGHASREQLHDAVEDNRGNPAEVTGEKIVDVVVCKLRRKLAPLGVILHTVHAIGYEMSEPDRKKVWALIEGERQ